MDNGFDHGRVPNSGRQSSASSDEPSIALPQTARAFSYAVGREVCSAPLQCSKPTLAASVCEWLLDFDSRLATSYLYRTTASWRRGLALSTRCRRSELAGADGRDLRDRQHQSFRPQTYRAFSDRYWITSSARITSDDGRLRPRAPAARRLTISRY